MISVSIGVEGRLSREETAAPGELGSKYLGEAREPDRGPGRDEELEGEASLRGKALLSPIQSGKMIRIIGFHVWMLGFYSRSG